MTELEQRAEEYAINNICDYCFADSVRDNCKQACKAKQIYKDAYEAGYKSGYGEGNNAVNKELQDAYNELNDFEKNQCAKLLQQIEKMKCCENCKFWIDNDCTIDHDYDCKRWNNHNTDDYWELAE